jgi:uncharacterized membrane protein
MSDETLDVLIAVYLVPDLAQQDFGAFVKLAEEKTISTEGVVLVVKDADGEVHVEETVTTWAARVRSWAAVSASWWASSHRRCLKRRPSVRPSAG